jgi:hypothetical protein
MGRERQVAAERGGERLRRRRKGERAAGSAAERGGERLRRRRKKERAAGGAAANGEQRESVERERLREWRKKLNSEA